MYKPGSIKQEYIEDLDSPKTIDFYCLFCKLAWIPALQRSFVIFLYCISKYWNTTLPLLHFHEEINISELFPKVTSRFENECWKLSQWRLMITEKRQNQSFSGLLGKQLAKFWLWFWHQSWKSKSKNPVQLAILRACRDLFY